MITPLRRVGAGGDQENVIFLSPGVTVKPSGGPVGADVENQCIYPLTHKLYKGASIPCTLMVYVPVKFLALSEDTLM